MIKTETRVHTLFFPGFYTLETLSYILEKTYTKVFGITIPTQINQPTGALVIYNETGKKILLNQDLADFLDYDEELNHTSYITRLNSPTSIIVFDCFPCQGKLSSHIVVK